jgi:hypothetical protein
MFGLPSQGQVVTNLIAPLMQLWVRSQVEQVDDLRVNVAGADPQVLNGQIDRVELSGTNLQYRGVTARSLSLRGNDIRLDTRQALAGGGLRLLKDLRAGASLRMSEADVNNYLASPAFQEQIRNLTVRLPAELSGDRAPREVPLELREPRARLLKDRLELAAVVRIANGEPAPLRLSTGVAVAGPHQLRLVDPRLLDNENNSFPIASLDGRLIQLGEELTLTQVSVLPNLLVLEGSYLIQATPSAAPAAR